MSQENVELVRRFVAAWSAHDRDEMSKHLHPDAVFHSAITNVVGETFHGRDQILGVFDRWEEQWSEIRWEVDEYIDVDDCQVVTLHRVIARGRASGIETVREVGGLIEIRDGLVVRQWTYLDRRKPSKPPGCRSRALISSAWKRCMLRRARLHRTPSSAFFMIAVLAALLSPAVEYQGESPPRVRLAHAVDAALAGKPDDGPDYGVGRNRGFRSADA